MPEPKGLFELSKFLMADVTIGLGIAYISRLIFAAVQVAGTVVDFQMGFGVVNVIDPQTETQVSVTAQFHNILAILISPSPVSFAQSTIRSSSIAEKFSLHIF